MAIPKRPPVPQLSDNDCRHITEVVFGREQPVEEYEAMLVFGGSHPGLWETAIELYKGNNCRYIFITGGKNEATIKHESWVYGDRNEADVIEEMMIKGGIPKEILVKENKSTNSYENVVFIKHDIEERNVASLLCIAKSYGVGRQYRTIQAILPRVKVQMKGFATNIDGNGKIDRDNWTQHENWKSLVWGEYLRNYFYSEAGQIVRDFTPTQNIQGILNTIQRKEKT